MGDKKHTMDWRDARREEPWMTALEILADDHDSIPYRPRLNALTGSVVATILLQQINYWWHKSGRRAFYKFNAPCSHPDYRPGDSWQEELGLSRRELESALKSIATKIHKGGSRTEALKNALVIYWTDRHRKTYYELNERLFGERLWRLYLSNGRSEHYIGNDRNEHYSETRASVAR